MGYDCSVNKKKGCNYCLRRKPIEKLGTKMFIDDVNKDLGVLKEDNSFEIYFEINYCPVCGRKF
jgi:hypothetical protein